MELPKEWLAGKTVLTAADVKKMEPGSKVWIHQCYGRRGEHVWVKATVVQYGDRKKLKCCDHNGMPVIRDIKTAPNIAYTADNPLN